MPKSPLTKKEAIEEALNNYHNALLENIRASEAEVNAKQRKISAHKQLTMAKERLNGLEQDLMWQ